MQVGLGDRAKDLVTGLTGIVTAVSKHLYGCDRAFIQPGLGSDGKVLDGYWVDIGAIESIERGAIKVELKGKKTGGPMSKVR